MLTVNLKSSTKCALQGGEKEGAGWREVPRAIGSCCSGSRATDGGVQAGAPLALDDELPHGMPELPRAKTLHWANIVIMGIIVTAYKAVSLALTAQGPVVGTGSSCLAAHLFSYPMQGSDSNATIMIHS